MEKDKEDPMQGVFSLISIAQSEIHANRAEKLCFKLLENFNNLKDEEKEIERMFFKMITENTSFEDFIIPLRKDIQEVKGMLGLPTSHIILVTIPEKLGIMETHRTIKFLRQMNLDAEGVIVNRIVPDFGSEWEVDLNIVKLTRGEFDTHCENLTLAGTLFGSEVNIIFLFLTMPVFVVS